MTINRPTEDRAVTRSGQQPNGRPMSTAEKLAARLAALPPNSTVQFVIVTGPDGAIVTYSEIASGKAIR